MSIKNIYIPKLRFKGFNNQYNYLQLKDVSTFKKGQGFSKKDVNDKGKYPIILYGDLFTTYNSVITNVIQHTDNANGYFSKKNTLLFPSSSTSLNDFFPCSSLNIENVILGSDINIFELDTNNNSDYFSYLFSTPFHLKRIFRLTEGSTINHLYGKYLESYNLVIPHIYEQEKIAKFFSLLDYQTSLLENKLQLMEQKLKYFLNNLLKIKKSNKIATLRYKYKKLNDICTIKKGDQINKIDLKSTGKYYYQNGGIEPSGWTDKFNRNANTISINEGGTCGFVKWHESPFWSGGHLYTLDINDKNINKKYLYFLLKANEKYIMKLGVGSSISNIQKKDLGKFNIFYLADTTEQSKITIFFNNLENLQKILMEKINLLQLEKKYFLDKIFVKSI